MHDDDARVVGARATELGTRLLDLIAPEISDDRDVAEIPGERPPRDALRGIQSHERGAGNTQHRLDVIADVLAVVREHRVRVAEAERRFPPRDVVIAGDGDDLAVAPR